MRVIGISLSIRLASGLILFFPFVWWIKVDNYPNAGNILKLLLAMKRQLRKTKLQLIGKIPQKLENTPTDIPYLYFRSLKQINKYLKNIVPIHREQSQYVQVGRQNFTFQHIS